MPSTKTLTTSTHNIEFTYSDFPFHFKVNKDKFALIKGEGHSKKVTLLPWPIAMKHSAFLLTGVLAPKVAVILEKFVSKEA